ncbi:MAG: glutaredoxin domain-containing protein [Anaerolineae bacterium]|jgi:glutaredoxin-like YruB-family protein|nr:glutaredoxin domain-containing protein [Anaerolineae bacterium]
MSTNEVKQPRVVVFSTPTCSYCSVAKRYLRERGISFTEVDVSRDQRAAQDMVRRSGRQGVPQIDIGGRIVVGFDRARIDQLLHLS